MDRTTRKRVGYAFAAVGAVLATTVLYAESKGRSGFVAGPFSIGSGILITPIILQASHLVWLLLRTRDRAPDRNEDITWLAVVSFAAIIGQGWGVLAPVPQSWAASIVGSGFQPTMVSLILGLAQLVVVIIRPAPGSLLNRRPAGS